MGGLDSGFARSAMQRLGQWVHEVKPKNIWANLTSSQAVCVCCWPSVLGPSWVQFLGGNSLAWTVMCCGGCNNTILHILQKRALILDFFCWVFSLKTIFCHGTFYHQWDSPPIWKIHIFWVSKQPDVANPSPGWRGGEPDGSVPLRETPRDFFFRFEATEE